MNLLMQSYSYGKYLLKVGFCCLFCFKWNFNCWKVKANMTSSIIIIISVKMYLLAKLSEKWA